MGVDLLRVERFERVAAHPRGCALAFTERELAHADSLAPQRRAEHLTGRFAAKEAVAKALGRGLGQGLSWRDLEIGRDPWGAPSVTLRRGAARVARAGGVRSLTLSVSHQDGLVVAVACAEVVPPGAAAGDGPGERDA